MYTVPSPPVVKTSFTSTSSSAAMVTWPPVLLTRAFSTASLAVPVASRRTLPLSLLATALLASTARVPLVLSRRWSLPELSSGVLSLMVMPDSVNAPFCVPVRLPAPEKRSIRVMFTPLPLPSPIVSSPALSMMMSPRSVSADRFDSWVSMSLPAAAPSPMPVGASPSALMITEPPITLAPSPVKLSLILPVPLAMPPPIPDQSATIKILPSTPVESELAFTMLKAISSGASRAIWPSAVATCERSPSVTSPVEWPFCIVPSLKLVPALNTTWPPPSAETISDADAAVAIEWPAKRLMLPLLLSPASPSFTVTLALIVRLSVSATPSAASVMLPPSLFTTGSPASTVSGLVERIVM